MTTHQVFGAVDRDTEDAQIHANPPAAVGNPRGGSVLDQLQTLFKGYDEQHTAVLPARAKSGTQFWFEFDLDITEEDIQSYQTEGQNRAGNRAGKTQPLKAKVYARTLSDRNLKVYTEDPEQGGKPLLDPENYPLTVHSEEWLQALKIENPTEALRALLGDVKLTALYFSFMEAVGHIGDPEAVDPTRDSSGD